MRSCPSIFIISTTPNLDLPILPTAILALKSRACFKFFSTFTFSHFTESKNFMTTFILKYLRVKVQVDLPGFKSLAIISKPRLAMGITNGPIPQHKSTTFEPISIKSAIILCSSCNLEFQ